MESSDQFLRSGEARIRGFPQAVPHPMEGLITNVHKLSRFLPATRTSLASDS